MDAGFLALLIPIIGVSIPVIAIWTNHQRKMAEMQIGATAEHTAEMAAQYAAKTQQLEDRVQVLERIVTDRGYDVATQIEALRDTREVEERGSGVQMSFEQKEKA